MKTNKQIEREEKKKKKLAALANLVRMNDEDRIKTAEKDRTEDVDDDGFVKVIHKKKSRKGKESNEEPDIKRAKIETTQEAQCQQPDAEEDEDGTEHCVMGAEFDELSHKKLTLSEEQYKDLRRQLRERKRQLENVPALRLREFGIRAALETPQEQRTPIFLTDIQHLVMAALIGKHSPCKPDRWCYMEKAVRLSHSIVLILEGMSLYQYLSNESRFDQTNKIFETRLELVLPPNKHSKIIDELAQVPLTNVQAQHLVEQYGSLESAVEMLKDPTLLVKAIFPIEETETKAKAVKTDVKGLPPGDKIPRTKLLLSALQMVDEGYPMPLRGALQQRFQNYIFTKDKYAPVTDHSPLFGVDCEMCRTVGGVNELTRVSIVNEEYQTVYETLVMPTKKIIDYLTPYSGITAEVMESVTKQLADVQKEVRALLPDDAILVGQSLNSDLNALRMMHPYVIDTSVCFNLSGLRKRKSKLQKLAMTFLKEAIQEHVDGHDSVEDSLASLKLVKMKLANSLEFGDEILTQKKRLLEIIRLASAGNITNNLLAHLTQRDKRTAIITAESLNEQLKEILQKAEAATTSDNLKTVTLYELETNKAAVRKAREIALEHSLTIANLSVLEEELHPDVAEKTVERLDKWIGKLWKTVAHNGMFVVLMGGDNECPSGVAKIAIKRNVGDVAAEAPITVMPNNK